MNNEYICNEMKVDYEFKFRKMLDYINNIEKNRLIKNYNDNNQVKNKINMDDFIFNINLEINTMINEIRQIEEKDIQFKLNREIYKANLTRVKI